MDILAIGNSFSRDATRYLYGIAKADGETARVVGLAIGGCSLQFHYKHYMADDPLYELWIDGEYTEFFISIKEALLNRDWDVITIQQATFSAINYDTYQPFLNEMVAVIRKYCPKAKLAIHETWALSPDNKRFAGLGFDSSASMYEALRSAYQQAYKDANADILLPSGRVADAFDQRGIDGFYYDDGHHASLGKGRYALALTWYKTLFGRPVTGNSFRDFDVEISEEDVALIQRTVDDVIDLSKN